MRSVILFLCFLSMASCLDTIDLDLPNNRSGRLVIEGVAERSPDNYRFLVSARRTQNLVADTATSLEPAVVFMLLNGKPILELENGRDVLMTIDSFTSLFGAALEDDLFNIEVQTREGVFRSIDQPILEGPENSQILTEYGTQEKLNENGNTITRGFVKVFMNSELVNKSGRKVSALYSISGVFQFREVYCTDSPLEEIEICYIKDPFEFNQVNVLNGRTVSGDRIAGFEIGETNADYRFSSAYYFSVLQRSISHEAAEYWEQVKKSISREGTIFDAPVGAVQTNISQIEGNNVDVLGYFYTAGVDTIRHLASWEETGRQRNLCASVLVTDACCSCLLFRNSSLEKPSFWIE